jgi:microcystin-dependent protein
MPTPDFSKVWASNSPLPEYTFSDADYLTGWDFVGSAPPTKNEFDAWFKLVDTKLNWLYGQLQDTASKLYPVGSVYISFNATDPSTLFGGTWARLKDTFLLANGDTYAPGTTGGSATKTISVNNLPAHNHSVNASGNHNHTATTSTAGNHTHTRGSMDITGTIVNSGGALNQAFGETFQSSTSISGAFTGRWKTQAPTADGEGTASMLAGFDFTASRSWSGTTSTNGNHTHTLTTTTNGNHTHTTNNTGGGLPLNIMPPYTTVYAWRRTA